MTGEDLSVPEACSQTVHDLVSLFPGTRPAAGRARDVVSSMCGEMIPARLSDGPAFRGTTDPDGTPLDVSLRISDGPPEIRWAVLNLGPGHRGSVALLDRLATQHGATVDGAKAKLSAMNGEHEGLTVLGGAVSASGNVTTQAYFAASVESVLRCARVDGPPGFAERLEATVADDRYGFVAVDLASEATARTKVYAFLRDFDLTRLGRYASLAGDLWPLPSAEALDALYGGVPTAVSEVCGPHVCFHLRQRQLAAVTLYLPCFPSWLDLPDGGLLTDGDVHRRVTSLLARRGGRSSAYDRVLEHFARRPLNEELWIHRFVSFIKDTRGVASLTAYLSPRFYYERFGVG